MTPPARTPGDLPLRHVRGRAALDERAEGEESRIAGRFGDSAGGGAQGWTLDTLPAAILEQELRVTDDVDEQDMSDLKPRLIARHRGDFKHSLNPPRCYSSSRSSS